MDYDAPQQRGAMEDSPAEFVVIDVLAEAEAKKLAAKQASAQHARNVRESGEIPEGREQNDSFWTASGKGVGISTNYANASTQREWHRSAMFMVSRGLTNREIGERLHKSELTISQLRRSPWFREQLEAIIEDEGRDSLQATLQGEVLNSVYTLIEMRDTAAKSSDRISAANSLIDRVLGKAPQTIQHIDGGRSEVAKNQSRIERELAEVENALKDMGVANLGEAEFGSSAVESTPPPPLSSQPSVQQTTPIES